MRPPRKLPPPESGLYVVIVCGGRDFTDRAKVYSVLDGAHRSIGVVVQGGARGADRFARQWCESRGVTCVEVPALWDAHGRSAGSRRNGEMLVVADALRILWPDSMGLGVLAFPGGPGTANMISRAREAGIDVKEVPRGL